MITKDFAINTGVYTEDKPKQVKSKRGDKNPHQFEEDVKTVKLKDLHPSIVTNFTLFKNDGLQFMNDLSSYQKIAIIADKVTVDKQKRMTLTKWKEKAGIKTGMAQ